MQYETMCVGEDVLFAVVAAVIVVEDVVVVGRREGTGRGRVCRKEGTRGQDRQRNIE